VNRFQPLRAVLSRDPQLAGLVRRTDPLRRAQAIYERIVPAALASVSRVLLTEGTQIRLAADNGAAASRLRQMAPSLAQDFTRAGVDCTSIRVSVQVRPARRGRRKDDQKQIDETGRRALGALADSTPDADLKRVLTRLLNRSMTKS
jgi:hypothetical protein